MKTIYVEPQEIKLGDKTLGTVTNISVNGSIQLFSDKVAVWIHMNSSSSSLANNHVEIECPSDKVVWADIEAAILSHVGLVKSSDQNPTLPSPIIP